VQFFAPFGEIVSCRIMVERESGLSRGFVSFQHPESAERAIVNLNGELRGAAC
jgi:CUG-BP- and ETR3-like factor